MASTKGPSCAVVSLGKGTLEAPAMTGGTTILSDTTPDPQVGSGPHLGKVAARFGQGHMGSCSVTVEPTPCCTPGVSTRTDTSVWSWNTLSEDSNSGHVHWTAEQSATFDIPSLCCSGND